MSKRDEVAHIILDHREAVTDLHDRLGASIARAETAEAKVAAVEVVLREITDAGQDALVGGFPEVRERIRAALGVDDD